MNQSPDAYASLMRNIQIAVPELDHLILIFLNQLCDIKDSQIQLLFSDVQKILIS